MHLGARFVIGVVSVVSAVFSMFGVSFFDGSVSAHKEAAVIEAPKALAPSEPLISGVPAKVPQVASIVPADGATEVLLDIEDPIEVRFDATTDDFFVDFRLDPPVSVAYENNPEKTVFKLLPKEPLPLSTPYTLKTFIRRRGMDDSAYTLLATSRFTTPTEKLTGAKQATLRKLADAKRNTEAKILQGRYIDVSLVSQVMVLFEDGKPLDAYMISSGKRGMETPKGQFKIENKARKPWSKQYGLYMPYWMAITPSGKFGIHELPEWPGGYKEGANHLGIPVSHGCVRLGVGAAQRAWEFADIGTPVIVH
ncbi:MAG: L,D-transpeptidase family protein [Candidatus Moranbacteria bacterium]|nr:L,D-transpeptidase family protein [Candidatus Moranbacteria bacterium]